MRFFVSSRKLQNSFFFFLKMFFFQHLEWAERTNVLGTASGIMLAIIVLLHLDQKYAIFLCLWARSYINQISTQEDARMNSMQWGEREENETIKKYDHYTQIYCKIHFWRHFYRQSLQKRECFGVKSLYIRVRFFNHGLVFF